MEVKGVEGSYEKLKGSSAAAYVLCLSAQSSFRVMLSTDFVRGYSYFVPVGTLQRKTGLADSDYFRYNNVATKALEVFSEQQRACSLKKHKIMGKFCVKKV